MNIRKMLLTVSICAVWATMTLAGNNSPGCCRTGVFGKKPPKQTATPQSACTNMSAQATCTNVVLRATDKSLLSK